MTTTLQTLKGLDLVSNVATPIPASVSSFYSGTLSRGTGPNGTFLITDILPGASGIRENPALEAAVNLIANPVTTNLDILYAQMVNVVDSTYGTPPTITIPTGPAAGIYANYNDALSALIQAADDEIGVIVGTSTVSDLITEANTTWTTMSRAWAQSENTRADASINFGTLPTTAQVPVTAFVAGLNQQGVDTEVGMSAQYLESVANTATQSGQALVGCLRQSRNDAALDGVGIGRDNAVPDQPTSQPPQADLGNVNYTVSEARVYAQANLST